MAAREREGPKAIRCVELLTRVREAQESTIEGQPTSITTTRERSGW